MKTFVVKTYKAGTEFEQPHFYILNKGLNSGKPLIEPCPNCYVLCTNSIEERESFYWLCFGLWRSKSFHYYLKGSVIPFITIDDLRKGINHGMNQANNNKEVFTKSVKALQLLEEKEKQFLQNIKLIEEAKRVVFYRYMKRS